jgi:hypothetical protein
MPEVIMARKRKKPSSAQRSAQWVSGADASLNREVDYIIGRAQQGDGRIVSLGVLVFFSTPTGDAWVLDPEDGYALCLARDGVRQPARLFETGKRFFIEWDRTYRIEGDLFITADRSGQVSEIAGYPTRDIVAAIERLRQVGVLPSGGSAGWAPAPDPGDERD